MKQQIEKLMQFALKELQEKEVLPAIPAFIEIEAVKDHEHGDFTSNIAMILAKITQKPSREIAELIAESLPTSPYFEKVEVAGLGFINFFLSPLAMQEVLTTIYTQKEAYGRCKIGRGKRILIEFLSANPTGPLHVGHGRHIAFGTVMANLLDAVGFKSFREYYINDCGRQTDILALSVWLRYLSLCGEDISLPANAYQGDYVLSIAQAIYTQHHTHFCVPIKTVLADMTPLSTKPLEAESYLDALIKRTKELLGDKYLAIFNLALENILADIREELATIGIHFDNWFSERQFVATGMVDKFIDTIKQSEFVYEKEGALWFKSSAFSDEKDRVLIRSNGQRTYFANDLAYHWNKFDRGFDIAVDVLGSDHHGYVARLRAAIQVAGIDSERLIHLLVQFVTLYRGEEQLQMSIREGNFVTLRALREEVGNDALRFYYLMRRNEQHIDFDLELAKLQSNDNPVYYVQYAYARICSVFKQLEEQALSFDEEQGIANVGLLTHVKERQLLNTLCRYPDMIVNAALRYEPHLLTAYLRELAADFHSFYNSHHFIVKEDKLRHARLALISATRQTLLNGFNLLGINAPVSM